MRKALYWELCLRGESTLRLTIFDSNVHITYDSGYRTKIRVDKDRHLETP